MESERLLFKEISEEDAEDIVKWRSDKEAYQFFLSPHKLTLSEHLDWYHNVYLSNPDRTDYIAAKKNTGMKIGVFGIIRHDDSVEVNYLVGKGFRGKGYALEAVEYLIGYAKALWRVNTAILEVNENNLPSLSLAKKLGFTESEKDNGIVLLEKSV